MRLLTNGIVMVMIVGDKPEVLPVPLFEDQVDEEMDWEKQNPKIKSLSQIKQNGRIYLIETIWRIFQI